jgi:hypothetical protein
MSTRTTTTTAAEVAGALLAQYAVARLLAGVSRRATERETADLAVPAQRLGEAG